MRLPADDIRQARGFGMLNESMQLDGEGNRYALAAKQGNAAECRIVEGAVVVRHCTASGGAEGGAKEEEEQQQRLDSNSKCFGWLASPTSRLRVCST